MHKSTLIFALVALALGLGAAHSRRQYNALVQSIASDKEQCVQEIAQLQNDYRAQLLELQQQLLQGR